MYANKLPTPEWENQQLKSWLESIGVPINISSVTSFEMKPVVPEGENFLGMLSRLEVIYTSEGSIPEKRKMSLIIKCPPSCHLTRKFMDDIKAIKTEIHMYSTILPAMYQIVDEIPKENTASTETLTPKCFHSSINTLILEDLTPEGYIMKDRCKLFDFLHTKAVVKALGRFHGLSHALYIRAPLLFDDIKENQFTHAPDRFKAEKDFSAYRINMLIKVIEKWPGYEHYKDKLSKVTDNLVHVVREVVKPSKDSISVLNHGDCWVNNILFHYNSSTGDIDDIKFIDFQMCRFSSPVLDLHYLFYTSVREEVLFQKKNDLLEEYHTELSRTLSLLNCEAPYYTFGQFKKEFYEKEYFGFFNAITKLCTVLAEPSFRSEEAKLLESDGDKCVENSYKNNVLLKDMFKSLLPYFESKGFI